MNSIQLYRMFLTRYQGKKFTINAAPRGRGEESKLMVVEPNTITPCGYNCVVGPGDQLCSDRFYINGWCSWRFDE